MNFVISLLYAPLAFTALRYFDIQVTSLIIFAVSMLWLLLSLRKEKKQTLYPLLYIFIALMAYFLKDFNILKLLPLLISTFMTLFISISYLRNNSVILFFAKKFARHDISADEQEYIHRSTLFWIGVSLINVLIHLRIFLDGNNNYWIAYSSFGWYIVFLLAGLLQFLHRKFIFAERHHDA